MMTEIQRNIPGIVLLLSLTGLVLGLSVDERQAFGTRRSELGKDSGIRSGGALFKEEIDLSIKYFKEKLPPLLEGKGEDLTSVQPEWSKIVRRGIGEGIYSMELRESRWSFSGFVEKYPVALAGEPPAVFKSLKNLKIFGFDAIKVSLVGKVTQCVIQQYELTFPRVLVEFSDGTPTREIILNPFYVTDLKYCKDEEVKWSPFESQFYRFMAWWSCDRFGSDGALEELLAQVSWFIAHQLNMHGEPYEHRNKWCTFIRKKLE